MFDSPQVEWYVISSAKIIVHAMPQELANELQKLKNERRKSLVPILPSINKTLALVVENYAKTDIKVFFPCQVLLDFLTFCNN